MENRKQALSLPNVDIFPSSSIPVEEYLLVVGGRAPTIEWLRDASKGRTVCCADRGADVCLAAGIVPSLFVGDCDSVGEDAKRWLERAGVLTRFYPEEKDKTDTQIALDSILEDKKKTIILTGCFGGRFDHALITLYSFIGANVIGCLADEKELIFILRGSDEVAVRFTRTPEVISLLPLSDCCENVSIGGVHWPLSNARIYKYEPYTVSNRLESRSNSFSVGVGKGILAVYVCFEKLDAK